MELVVEPDIYTPSIDYNGNYTDKIPSFNIIKKGLLCPCGSRKDKIYETQQMFSSHIKSKIHQKWIENLNLNKTNYYVENEKMKSTVKNQQIIIAELQKELNNRSITIDYLTQQLSCRNNSTSKIVDNLLDFD
jgi:hypothetical protein